LAAARNLPGVQARRLSVPGDRPPADDDPWTAFVLMFHDHEWEEGLLEDALAGPAFYVGALGGRKTHANRRERLIKKGIAREQVERVRGPIGLVASLRSSGMVAVSTLAEIVQVFETRDITFREAEAA
jgi:xanthine dehydrogenase accessory factor